MNKTKVKKVVLLAAGFGTRFLPATKVQPKEMLPVVDKPVIQYLVEEAVESGVREVILITGKNKRAIEDHFDRSHDLEEFLKSRGKGALVEEVKKISNLAFFASVRQREPRGTADAVLEARSLIGNEPFAVMSADDIIDARPPALAQLISVYEKYHAPVVCLMRVPRREVNKYGVIEGKEVSPGVWKIMRAVEKPQGEIPSNLAIVVKYVLTPEFLPFLEKVKPQNGEMHIPPAIQEYVRQGGDFYGYEVKGDWLDCGSKLGFLKATVQKGITHPEIGKEFKKYLKSLSL